MPRRPRNEQSSGWLDPGRLYHVTNRGVNRCEIFQSDLDRIVFLSVFAEACLRLGVVCHAWCLMTTHFHFVVEDIRGQLPQLLHSVESVYARYFNDTRPNRRGGPLFESRYRAKLIDSDPYFEDACAYVLLNPLKTAVPLAETAERYRWSSAAFVCCDLTPATAVGALVDPLGGIDAVLEALPRSARKASRERRRARLEALIGGTWMAREHVRGGRTAAQYRAVLALRARLSDADGAPFDDVPNNANGTMDSLGRSELRPSTPARRAALASRPPFAGFDLASVKECVVGACESSASASLMPSRRLRDLCAYALYRFTSATCEQLARALGMTADAVERRVRAMRSDRASSVSVRRLSWLLEWSLRWKLGAAPHRA